MPRVSTKDNNEEPKRAPRRQIVRKATTSRIRKTPATTVVEKRADSESVPTRKAPTVMNNSKSKVRFSRKTIIFSGAFVAVLATAIWIGNTDNGQINVISKIEERNAQIANGEFTADNSSGTNGSQVVPVQNGAPTVPNGGLKGRGVGTPPVNSQQASVVTASSTENATSTEATSTEAVNNSEATQEVSAEGSGVENINGTSETETENSGEESVGSEVQ
jgi:hypothetical protein